MSSDEPHAAASSPPTADMQSLTLDEAASPSVTAGDGGDTEQANTTGETAQNGAQSAAQAGKIDILLNATGNVPIMKRRKWQVEPDKPVSWIIAFVHKYLKLKREDKIFLYVNQTFAPSPDQTLKNLYDCYESNGRLVLYYCKSQAWG